MASSPFSVDITPDWEAFLRCVRREGTPSRVHHAELFLDPEVQEALCQRFGLVDGLMPGDPWYAEKRQIAIQRFVGYDYLRAGWDNWEMPLRRVAIGDTAELERETGRSYIDEHRGPITNWDEFGAYPWPDPAKLSSRALEWYEDNLPDDMCLINAPGFGSFAQYLNWLMGYETLCYALRDQRDLVAAISQRLIQMYEAVLRRLLEFKRIRVVWSGDDMGFKSGTLISPRDLREFVLPGHKRMARIAHEAGRLYFLHSCGNLAAIMPDLIDDIQIDARHSFEDVIEPVAEAKQRYGSRVALLGGIDLDFLCRADEQAVRQRVRETLDACLPGGGYCLGTGNSVANYIPLSNYMAMVDEGRRYDAGL